MMQAIFERACARQTFCGRAPNRARMALSVLPLAMAVRLSRAGLWDAASGLQVAVLMHDDAVSSAEFSPDGSRVVTGSYDKTARVWDAATGLELAVLRAHTAGVIAATFSPDGSLVATGSDDNTARVWDASSGARLAVLRPSAGAIRTSASTWADTTTPHGRLMLTVLAGLAEFERELIRTRIGGSENEPGRGERC